MKLPQPGELFARRFRIEETLGEGAFGAVYLAFDERAKRPVAVKVLKPGREGYDPSHAARFDREGEVVATLQSPYTVTLHDRGVTEDGLMFMVFERVPGEDLSEFLKRRGTLQPGEVVHILNQVLDSLREAHRRGLLHRDVKPQNIRVFQHADDPLRVKVLDFGLARATDHGHPAITATGELLGTPRYMSPEQLYGRQLTSASDIYSLGLVAIELLLGREVLGANQLQSQIGRLLPEHAFDLDGVEPRLAAVLRRMTASEPNDRYQTAASVIHALADEPDRRAVPDVPHEALPQKQEQEQEHDSRRPLVATGVLLLVLYAVAVTYSHVTEPEGAPAPPLQTTENHALLEPELLHQPTIAVDDEAAPDIGDSVDADAVPPDGCGAAPPFTGLGQLRAGVSDTLAYVPEAYDPDRRYPVLLVLHQIGRTPKGSFAHLGFERLADAEQFIVLLPDGGRNPRPWSEAALDADRISAVVGDTAGALCVDTRRVYAVGLGQGGRMASILGCRGDLTAAATYAYRPDVGTRLCKNRQIPMLLLSAKKSGHNPFEGGTACSGADRMAADDFVEMWREQNACSGKRKTTFEYRGSECFTYDCDTALEACYLNGGHNWPGAPPRPTIFDLFNCDGPPTDFPMLPERIWQFFENAPPLDDHGHQTNDPGHRKRDD